MTGSSTLMLRLLLLPLVITFCLSSARPCIRMQQFTTHLNNLSGSVKDCGNCNSIHITDKCKCFNLTAHIGRFPDYFIHGLNSLNHSSHSQFDIDQLRTRLEDMVNSPCKNKINFTSLVENYEPVISPADLVQKMEEVTQKIKTLLSHPRSNRR